MKVFIIGLYKTGTMSFHKMFIDKGFNSYRVNTRLFKEKGYDFRALSKHIEHNNLISETPIPFLYEQLCTLYPESKFILTLRKDFDTWFKSFKFFCNSVGYSKVKEHYYNVVNPYNLDKSYYKFFYVEHILKARRFFKSSNRYMEFIVGVDDVEKINDFLGTDFKEFPHTNKRGYKNIHKFIKSKLRKSVYYMERVIIIPATFFGLIFTSIGWTMGNFIIWLSGYKKHKFKEEK